MPPKWPLGEPDVIVEIPAFDVPASGIIDYQERSVATEPHRRQMAEGDGLGRLHAGRAPRARGLDPGSARRTARASRGTRRSAATAPAAKPNLTPDDTGIYIAAGRLVRLPDALHDRRQDDDRQDGGRVLLLQGRARHTSCARPAITDFSLEIPAGAARHHETAYLSFPHDAADLRHAAALPLALLLDQARASAIRMAARKCC